MQIHSTPQQRKSLPSRGLKSSTNIYLQQKAQRDNQLWNNGDKQLQTYWIVENKCYDLRKFADSHPGGSTWINYTKGQDITEHFVTHHLNEQKARETLSKYYVKDCANNVTRFSFHPDGLYRGVKRRLLEKYQKGFIRDETISRIYAAIFIVAWFISVLLVGMTGSYILAFISGNLLIGVIGIGHNFIHHKDNIISYCILLTGFTHRQWKIMHCISHHLYPNTQLDYEAAAMEPIAYYLRSLPPNKWYTQIFLQPLFLLLQPINMTLKIVVVPIVKRVLPDHLYGFPLLVLAFLYFMRGQFIGALLLYLTIYCSFGFLFTKVLFCGHRLQSLWTQGGQKIQDFGQHTVLATSDSDTWLQGIWSYLFFAGFNIHIAHHFFPTADHEKLPLIMQIIKEECAKRGIKYTSQNRWECIKSVSKGIRERKPFIRK